MITISYELTARITLPKSNAAKEVSVTKQ